MGKINAALGGHAQFRWYQHDDADDRTSSILVKMSSCQLENYMKEPFEFTLMEILKKNKRSFCVTFGFAVSLASNEPKIPSLIYTADVKHQGAAGSLPVSSLPE